MLSKSSMATEQASDVKRFYASHHDRISDKRYNSPYWIRRFTHRGMLDRNLRHVAAGDLVLDGGCGEGIFCVLAAERGATVVGCDMSRPNLRAARDASAGQGAWYVQADL